MHEVIQHVGIVFWLNAWQLAAAEKINRNIGSLDDFTRLKPTWDTIIELVHHLCQNYVGNKSHVLASEWRKPHADRDQQHENVLLQHQYFLLYKEISYVMNYRDIGCVETLFLPWMWIFRGCGKHKYAVKMKQYLEDVHFIYPEGLRFVFFCGA